jgi:hypothetical protein
MLGRLKGTIPSKVKIGFGAAFTSWVLDTLLEVLQMKGIVLPPTSLDVAFYGLIVLLGFGLAMMVLGFIEWARKTRQQKQVIEKQSDDIASLESSLELFRQGFHSPYNTYLMVLPYKLTQIHQTLQSAARQIATTSPDDTLLFDILQLWAARIGVRIWYKPKNGKFNKLLWKLQLFTMIIGFKRALTPVNDTTMVMLYQLASDLDDKGIGLSSRLDDSYAQMRTEVDGIVTGLGSQVTSKYVQKYLLHSYSLNSLLLFWKHIGNPVDMKWVPRKFQISEAFVIQITNNYMLNLRAEVVNHIQLYLLGKE